MKRKLVLNLLAMSAILSFPVSVYAIEVNDASVIFATQNALNKAGFNCGTADGVIGANTSNAITQYQTEKGLEITGKINEQLLISLGFSIDDSFGIDVTSFVARYNESAVYFNNISAESGDALINQIVSENVFSEKGMLDGITTVSFGLNNVGSYVDSCTVQDNDGIYDVKNLYELSSVAYALNTTYSSPADALTGVQKLFEDYKIENDNLTYSILNAGDKVTFSFAYKKLNK